MRQVRHILRLAHDGVSTREIGRRIGVARSTIQDNLKRAAAAELSWPLLGEMTDDALERLLFARTDVRRGSRRLPEPDWARLAVELKRAGVTLTVLWDEYRAAHPEGYGYSRFCDLFRSFQRRLSPTMRQNHTPGDKAFVDFSGKTLPIVDRRTGETREAQIFIAVLGASSFTYAEAVWTQTLPDWIGAHVRMFDAFGGAPRLIVPDNLKAGVHKASFYDPEINRSYAMMASHYGVDILPARPRRPRDKAKVENGVRFAQSCILGRLRNQTFFSLAEANAAIEGACERINAHVMKRVGVTRRHLFETLERPALGAPPADAYEFAEWRFVRVSLDYHVAFDGFFYSVPHALIREQVDLRATARMIELFHRGRRVAVHQRRGYEAGGQDPGRQDPGRQDPGRQDPGRQDPGRQDPGRHGSRHVTTPEHMPRSHRRYAEWTPERFRRWARTIGPNTEGLIAAILARRSHPEQGFRSCIGVLRLLRDIDADRAEAVAAWAVEIGAFTCKSIASIIERGLERRKASTTAIGAHANLRGPGYFH